jgi:hypothetical protein
MKVYLDKVEVEEKPDVPEHSKGMPTHVRVPVKDIPMHARKRMGITHLKDHDELLLDMNLPEHDGEAVSVGTVHRVHVHLDDGAEHAMDLPHRASAEAKKHAIDQFVANFKAKGTP